MEDDDDKEILLMKKLVENEDEPKSISKLICACSNNETREELEYNNIDLCPTKLHAFCYNFLKYKF